MTETLQTGCALLQGACALDAQAPATSNCPPTVPGLERLLPEPCPIRARQKAGTERPAYHAKSGSRRAEYTSQSRETACPPISGPPGALRAFANLHAPAAAPGQSALPAGN